MYLNDHLQATSVFPPVGYLFYKLGVLRAGLDVVAKIKIPDHFRNRTPVIQPVASHFTGSAIVTGCPPDADCSRLYPQPSRPSAVLHSGEKETFYPTSALYFVLLTKAFVVLKHLLVTSTTNNSVSQEALLDSGLMSTQHDTKNSHAISSS
jgi:hypothetical protein